MPDFGVYTAFVCSEEGREERRHMISALTTNVSHFFREGHHFEFLAKEILPVALPKLRSGGRMRIWSAGCSNGQEACSIAMTLLEHDPDISGLDIKILATDIDPNVIHFGRTGSYPERFVGGVPQQMLSKYFSVDKGTSERCFTVNSKMRDMISFRELNLLGAWPMKQQMDIIFCRNVVIYFDQTTQNDLWPRFRSALNDNGRLFLGHSERIIDPERFGFVADGPTTYRTTSGPEMPRRQPNQRIR
jgi:chemotaxis protein methyltransferase CheR